MHTNARAHTQAYSACTSTSVAKKEAVAHVPHEAEEVLCDNLPRVPVGRNGHAGDAVLQQLRQCGEGEGEDRKPAAQHVHHLLTYDKE